MLENAGKISTAVIRVGGFLGVGEKDVDIPYGELRFDNKDDRRVAVMDATKESLMSAPKYAWTEKSGMQKIKDRAAGLTNKASGTDTKSSTAN